MDPGPPEKPMVRLPIAFSAVRFGPEVDAEAGFMEGSRARLNLVIWSGVKHSLR